MTWDISKKAKMESRQRAEIHDEMIRREAQEQAARDADNAETRRKYRAGLEAEKAEEAKLADLALDIELEPRKEVLLRQWLADHPGKTSTDFDRSAWPHLRANLIVERRQTQFEADKAAAARIIAF